MKLIFSFLFSFLFISPALAQSGGGETGGGLLILLVIIAVIFLVVRNRKRGAANKRAAEQAEIAQQLSRERAEIINNQPTIAIRTYKGTQEQATRLFQADAAGMAAGGYLPTNQSWAPTRRPIRTILLFGLIFSQPTGALTVTYERRKVSVEDEEKTCPQCAERVKAAALVCRFCGYQFPSEKVLP